MIRSPNLPVSILLLLLATPAAAQTSDEELLQAFGDEEFISIATGYKQPLRLAPSVASVITADDISRIGATDLDEVLEIIPGLHVSRSATAYNPVYMIRGVHSGSDLNPQVLILIDGVPQTNVFAGNRGQAWKGMPVKAIQRIEIIRGPGSAIYGADAFAGVINVVTKRPEDIHALEVGGRAGSFGTIGAWMLQSGSIGPWRSAFSLELDTTDGHEEIISADTQTGFDLLTGTSASLAPGPISLAIDRLDARLRLVKPRWQALLGLQLRTNGGVGVGSSQALDSAGEGNSHRFSADLRYENDAWHENWGLALEASAFDLSVRTDLVLFPPGADFTALGGSLFSNGVIGNPDVYERHWRVGAIATYKGVERHRIQLAGGYILSDLYKIKETKNFVQNPIGIPISLGSVVDVTATTPFIRPRDRDIWYAWAQDEWSFAPDWRLTAGVRYDRYSDFGSTTNPRLALVWNASLPLTLKFLYGRAFRPPSFAELFNINNPVALGNQDLEAETIDTVELAFDYRPQPDLRMNLSLFTYRWKDIIRFVPDPAPATSSTAQNTGELDGYGFEYELHWKMHRNVTMQGNYAWQRATDEATDSSAGYTPGQQVRLRADWRYAPGWNLGAQINFVADRDRPFGDTRPPVDDYSTLDVTLRKTVDKGWGFAFIARNVLDEDGREPSLAPGLIPNDLPLAGASALIEVSHRF